MTLFKKLDFGPEELLTLNPLFWVWMQSLSHDGRKSALDASTQRKVWGKWLFYSMLWKWSASQFSLKATVFSSVPLCFGPVAWRETCWMGSYWLVLLALFMDQWAHTCLVVTECILLTSIVRLSHSLQLSSSLHTLLHSCDATLYLGQLWLPLGSWPYTTV